MRYLFLELSLTLSMENYIKKLCKIYSKDNNCAKDYAKSPIYTNSSVSLKFKEEVSVRDLVLYQH